MLIKSNPKLKEGKKIINISQLVNWQTGFRAPVYNVHPQFCAHYARDYYTHI